jgi:hypothetical protein
MSNEARAVLVGVLFVLTFASGFWLWNTRHPVPGLKLNLHKFLALGALGVSIWQVNDLRLAKGMGAAAGATAAAAVFFLITIVSGGLVSLEKPPAAAVEIFHRVGPFLTAAATAAAIALLG